MLPIVITLQNMNQIFRNRRSIRGEVNIVIDAGLNFAVVLQALINRSRDIHGQITIKFNDARINKHGDQPINMIPWPLRERLYDLIPVGRELNVGFLMPSK